MSAQELIGQELIQLQHSMPILSIRYVILFPNSLSSLSSPSPDSDSFLSRALMLTRALARGILPS